MPGWQHESMVWHTARVRNLPKIRDRVRAEERHRLALELHDTVGQTLVLTKLQLARMQQQLREPLNADTHAWLQTALEALIPEVDLAIQTVQSEIFTLRLPASTDEGMPAGFQLECQAFRRRTGIGCTWGGLSCCSTWNDRKYCC